MNRLSADKRRQILHLMVEGNTVNGIERLTGASKHTILRLLELAGKACMAHHDRAVRGVKAQRVECDEIWSFNYCKRANLAKAKAAPERAGDVRVILGLRVDVADQQRNRRSGRAALVHAGQDFNLVVLMPLRRVARAPGRAPLEIAAEIFGRQRQSRRATVDHAADRRPVAFAERRDGEDFSERIARHARYHIRESTSRD